MSTEQIIQSWEKGREPYLSETPIPTDHTSRNGQTTRWESWTFPCGTRRSRLYVNGRETPFFIDKASVRAHFTCGNRIGLFGSGMGNLVGKHRIAACFGAYRKMSDAKARALDLAAGLSDQDGQASTVATKQKFPSLLVSEENKRRTQNENY